MRFFNQTFNGRKEVLISQGPSCTCEWLITAADNDDRSPWQPLRGEASLVFALLLNWPGDGAAHTL